MNRNVTRTALLVVAAVAVLTLTMGLYAADSSGHPSAKATARCGEINILDATDLPWTTIMKSTIKCANGKDLFIDVSLQCGLYTKTRVKSKGGQVDAASAEAKVEVAVVIDRDTPDEDVAAPGTVVFAERFQELSAALEGMIGDCLSIDADTNSVIVDQNCVTPEEIQLILRTMSANAFNFIVEDVTPGVHTIEVRAKITTATDPVDPLADPNSIIAPDTKPVAALATIGKGSVTIEEVRCIKDDTITELGTP
ncbi:MAG: hypothetical protein ACYTEQ_17635 [Planctomycetota bacterium]